MGAVFVLLSSGGAFAQSKAGFSGVDWGSYAGEQIEVRAGVQIHQLTSVDQKSKNFGVVATLRLQWTDPNLVFEPEPGRRLPFRVYSGQSFNEFADANGVLAPGFVVLNRQHSLSVDDSTVVVFPDGSVIFSERFTVTLQAPDFDFRTYPFDAQHFYLHFGFLLPKEVMRVSEISGFSRMGGKLGEEEWMVEKNWVEISEWETAYGLTGPKFTFGFSAHRNLQYYILRIFVPLGVLVIVTYSAFLMRDFMRRIDICTTTLLTFVAFNFAISNDLPRLGYLTFLDVVMGLSFLIIGMTVVWNVSLRRLELSDREMLARRIDSYTLWIYPASQVVLIYLAWKLVS